ncbi:MAG: AraC family transcriptional regulator [Allorhizobium sp.]
MKAAVQNYQARMQRALEHIDQNLDGDLDLETVSRIAAFSKFHFHRQFLATFGLSVHRYVQLARMKRASHRLALKTTQTVTDIAMNAGYDAPDAFSRAFRQRIGQSPSSFRKSPDWVTWHTAFGPLENARSKLMQNTYHHDDVTIKNVAPTPVAIVEHRGDPATLQASIQRFITWRTQAGLHPGKNPTFTVWRSERRPENPADYSIDLCVGTDQPVSGYGETFKAGLIPGGRCAVLRVTGNTHNLEPAGLYLYRDWLPQSGEEPRDFPLYCQRLNLYPDVPDHLSAADIFLPLK